MGIMGQNWTSEQQQHVVMVELAKVAVGHEKGDTNPRISPSSSWKVKCFW